MKRFAREIVLLIIIACASAFLLRGRPQDSDTAEIRAVSPPSEPAAAMKNSTATSDDAQQMQSAQSEQVIAVLPVNTVLPADGVSTESDGSDDGRMKITIRVTGLRTKPSTLRVAVFESSEGFPQPEQSTSTTVVESDGDQAEFSLTLPVNHPLAIAVFQDLDGNKVITKNGFGIPTEPYGFSNKARGLLGPPTFQQAVVRVGDGQDTLEIQIR
ncbi:MAG: DUF2141 domain-containing protein [Planctomycetaceae bacterium]